MFARRFAGGPRVVIYDADGPASVREIPFQHLGEILNPTWSPDGRAIAFSAVFGGLTDLFVYDLETATARLTNDPFTDLQPAWSPDGRTIAFVTDRFTTSRDLASVPTAWRSSTEGPAA